MKKSKCTKGLKIKRIFKIIFKKKKYKFFHNRPQLRRPANTVSVTSSLTGSSGQLNKDSSEDTVLNELNDIYKLILPPNKFETQFSSRKAKPEQTKREDVMVTLKRYLIR